MTTRVDFAFGAPNRLRTACDVVRKHYLAGRKLIIYHPELRELQRFDRMLWGFEPTAFIPHVFVDDPLAPQTPIWLSTQPPQPHPQSPADAAWLLNLAPSCPPLPTPFQRILEIVSENEKDRRAARQRWRQYQQLNYDVRGHKLNYS